MCYIDPNCVSINSGPSHGGKYRFEFNSATSEDNLTVLEEKPTFTFLAIEVNIFTPVLCLIIVAIVFAFNENADYRYEIWSKVKSRES